MVTDGEKGGEGFQPARDGGGVGFGKASQGLNAIGTEAEVEALLSHCGLPMRRQLSG
jgi:hypothetical protein